MEGREGGIGEGKVRGPLSLPKLWLSRFLIFLYLAKVPPPSFFSLITTPGCRVRGCRVRGAGVHQEQGLQGCKEVQEVQR